MQNKTTAQACTIDQERRYQLSLPATVLSSDSEWMYQTVSAGKTARGYGMNRCGSWLGLLPLSHECGNEHSFMLHKRGRFVGVLGSQKKKRCPISFRR